MARWKECPIAISVSVISLFACNGYRPSPVHRNHMGLPYMRQRVRSEPIVLKGEINAILHQCETVYALAKVGVEAKHATTTRRSHRRQITKWRDVIVSAGIQCAIALFLTKRPPAAAEPRNPECRSGWSPIKFTRGLRWACTTRIGHGACRSAAT